MHWSVLLCSSIRGGFQVNLCTVRNLAWHEDPLRRLVSRTTLIPSLVWQLQICSNWLHRLPITFPLQSVQFLRPWFFYRAKRQFRDFVLFLGAFAKLRQATISLVLSVCPHGITRLPLDGFWWNMIFEIFSKTWRKFKFHQNPTKTAGTLREDVSTFLRISR
jgi:hypothetical protein